MRIGIDARKIADYGIGTYIRGLLAGLAEIGAPEEYVVFAPAEAADLISFGTHVPLRARGYSLQELVVVGRAVAHADLDVFHAPHYVVPFTRCPTVVTVHDLIHLHTKYANPLAPIYARTMISRAVRKSALVMTVSETVRQEILSHYHCPADRVVVSPNGVDSRFSPEGAKHTGDYLLFVGNDKPHKNVEVVVRAIGELRREGVPVLLLLAGSPFERFRGMDGIEIAGYLADEEMPALYRGATALLAPSIEEGFGLPALEAMACGTPVITSHAAALVEVTGHAALHVTANDAQAWRSVMRRVLNDPQLRQSLRSAGIDRARTFTWRRCAESTRGAYRTASIARENESPTAR